MTDDERRSFANLIYLCFPHHATVDKLEPEKYPIAVLERWKSAEANDERGNLSEIRGLTEEGLQQMVAQALDQRVARMDAALERFEQIDPQAVHMLRESLGDLAQAQLPNRDTAGMLLEAADLLSDIPRAARELLEAADLLSSLPDTVNQLFRAAEAAQDGAGY